MLGLTSLLTQSAVSEQQAAWARDAVRSGQALLTIVKDVLDVSKTEAGAVELETVSFDVLAVADDALLPVRFSAEEAGLSLVVAAASNFARHRTGDPSRLRQIIRCACSHPSPSPRRPPPDASAALVSG